MLTPFVLLFFVIFVNEESYGFEFKNTLTGIADNREYNNSVHMSQTIFGVLENGEIGVSIDSSNKLQIGVSYLMEFGAKESLDRAKLILFYRYKDYRNRFLIGSFPRRNVLKYPSTLLKDSLNYYRPCIEGAFYEYNFKVGRENIWIDWTGRQTTKVRETFMCGFSGTLHRDPLFLSHYILYYHFAGRKNQIPKDDLRDNGGALISFGCNFLEKGIFDSLIFHTDGIISYDRIRWKTSWHTPVGIQAGIRFASERFGGGLLYYNGIYKEHDEWHRIEWGESIYRAERFGKINVIYFPIATKYVVGKFVLTFYLFDGQVDSRQLFLLDFCFGKVF